MVAQEPTPAGQLSRPPAAGTPRRLARSRSPTSSSASWSTVGPTGRPLLHRHRRESLASQARTSTSFSAGALRGPATPRSPSMARATFSGAHHPPRRKDGPLRQADRRSADHANLGDAPVPAGRIEVAQDSPSCAGLSTRMFDTVQITYRLKPRGGNHRVGLRILLDTMLGTNDGAPVRAGSGAITPRAGRKAVPDYWQAFDSIAKPGDLQGSLRGGDLTRRQDLFADWGTWPMRPGVRSRPARASPVWARRIGHRHRAVLEPGTAAAGRHGSCAPPTASAVSACSRASWRWGYSPSESTFLHERTSRSLWPAIWRTRAV